VRVDVVFHRRPGMLLGFQKNPEPCQAGSRELSCLQDIGQLRRLGEELSHAQNRPKGISGRCSRQAYLYGDESTIEVVRPTEWKFISSDDSTSVVKHMNRGNVFTYV
jgi:hypothetical protein